MSFRKSASLILLALSLSVLATSVACKRSNGAPNNNGATPSPQTIVEVSTVPAVLRQLPRYFEATGSLAANEQTDVAPETSGKVAAVGVDIGSYVKRGQMIVKLDDAKLRNRVQQSPGQLDQTEAPQRTNEA